MIKRVVAGIALSSIFLFTGCNKKTEEKEEATVYPVTTPVVMDTVIDKEFVAQIRSVKNIEVRAQTIQTAQGLPDRTPQAASPQP